MRNILPSSAPFKYDSIKAIVESWSFKSLHSAAMGVQPGSQLTRFIARYAMTSLGCNGPHFLFAREQGIESNSVGAQL